MKTQRERKEESNARIIESAIRVFAKKGYSHTSIADIAKDAGITGGLICQRFGTKDHLFYTAYCDVMANNFVEAEPDATARECFTEKLRQIRSMYDENRDAYDFCLMLYSSNDYPRNQIEEYENNIIKTNVTYQKMAEAQKKGMLPQGDLSLLLRGFYANAFHHIFLCKKHGLIIPTDEFYLAAIQFVDSTEKVERPKTKKTILIVEDNAINRELIAEILSDEYVVLQAEDGIEGLEVLAQNYRHIALVILDLNMPRCDGYEFMETVKIDPILSDIPIVVQTSESIELIEKRCLELGALEFISKAADPRLIKIRLKNIINIRESSGYIKAIETDELTGVYTRQAFYRYATELMRDNPNNHYDISFIDISNFMLINGVYGIKTGDEVLLYVSDFCRELAKGGILARYGVDQFITLMRTEENARIANHIDEITRSFSPKAPIPGINIKIGIYSDVDMSLSLEEMGARAMLALDNIKNDHSRIVAFYDEIIRNKQLAAYQYAADFDKALQNGEFSVWYQPKVNPITQQVVGAEALVRWTREGQPVMSPGMFLSIFEENGQITRLDEYIFRMVCQQQATWKAKGFSLMPVSVNLSRKSLLNADIGERYKEIAKANDIDLSLVPIEITETAAVESSMLKPFADKLTNQGFLLHMDDFGTGESNVNGLTVMQFDTVKLDKSLIDTIGDEKGELTLAYLIKMIKKLGIKVVTEGVETKEQLDFVMRYSCDAVQGYYYSKPLTVSDYEEFVRGNRLAYSQEYERKANKKVCDIDFSATSAEKLMMYIPGPFFIYHADGNEEFISFNKELLQLMECDTKEEFLALTGGSFGGFVHKDDYYAVEKEISQQIAINDNGNDYVEYRVITKNGAVKWLRDYGHYVNTEEYGPTFFVFVSDATKIHDKSSEMEARYNRVINVLMKAYGSIYFIDVDNDYFEPYMIDDLNEKSIETIVKEKIYSELHENVTKLLVSENDQEEIRRELSLENLRNMLSEGRIYNNTISIMGDDGMAHTHRVTVVPCNDEPGRHEAVLCVHRIDS